MNPNDNTRSIPAGLYFFLASTGARYEGFVDGIGFVSPQTVTISKAQPDYPNEKNLYHTKYDRFFTATNLHVIIPGVTPNTGKYDQLTEEDIKRAIVSRNSDESIRVNLGLDQHVTLSPGSVVMVKIRNEHYSGKQQKTVTITTRDKATRAANEVKYPLEGIDDMLRETFPTLNTPSKDGIYLPEGSSVPSESGWSKAFSLADQINFYVGLAFSVAQEITYSELMGTWRGKNGKFYSQKFQGNKVTGGRLKHAYRRFEKIEKLGKFSTTSSVVVNFAAALTGQTTWAEFGFETGSDGISAAISSPYLSIGWDVGWELGRKITETEAYQHWKFETWYNHWESVIGRPTESNRELWKYFYENY